VTIPSRRRVKVKLLGELGRKFGRSYEFMALSPKEVLSALSNQLDGFKEYLRGAHENGVFFKLVTADPDGIDYNECMMPCDTLVIAPVITGAGGSGMSIGKILLGVVLIGLAFIPGVGTAAAGAACRYDVRQLARHYLAWVAHCCLVALQHYLRLPPRRQRKLSKVFCLTGL
jgi:predicted phage tail protein